MKLYIVDFTGFTSRATKTEQIMGIERHTHEALSSGATGTIIFDNIEAGKYFEEHNMLGGVGVELEVNTDTNSITPLNIEWANTKELQDNLFRVIKHNEQRILDVARFASPF